MAGLIQPFPGDPGLSPMTRAQRGCRGNRGENQGNANPTPELRRAILLLEHQSDKVELTQMGVWLTDSRTEKRRKRQKLEDSYIAWLNAQASVVGKLKALARLVQGEPDSTASLELILAKFE